MTQPGLRLRRFSKIDHRSSERRADQKRNEVILLAAIRQAKITSIPGKRRSIDRKRPCASCPIGRTASSSKVRRNQEDDHEDEDAHSEGCLQKCFLHLPTPDTCPAWLSILPALAPDGDLLALDLALAKCLDDAVGEVFGNLDE